MARAAKTPFGSSAAHEFKQIAANSADGSLYRPIVSVEFKPAFFEDTIMTPLKSYIFQIVSNEDGAVMVEYVFLLIFVAIVALGAVRTFGNAVTNKMSSNNNSVVNAIGP